ncbi:MAG: hypothetical protein ABFD97_14675 [Syntrophobacter sp.]
MESAQGKQVTITVDVATGKVTSVKADGTEVPGQGNPFPVDGVNLKNVGSFTFLHSNPCFWFFDGISWYKICS